MQIYRKLTSWWCFTLDVKSMSKLLCLCIVEYKEPVCLQYHRILSVPSLLLEVTLPLRHKLYPPTNCCKFCHLTVVVETSLVEFKYIKKVIVCMGGEEVKD